MSNGNLNKAIRETKKKSPTKKAHEVLAYPKEIAFWESERGLNLIEGWARDGLTNEQIATAMGVSVTTLWRWLKASAKMENSIMHARNEIDFEIENTLFKTARGFIYEEQTVTKDGDIVTVQRYQPPNLEAQKFILTNRKNGKWKARQDVNVNADVNAKLSKSDILADEFFGGGDN